ncbi:MAG: hypothetical protein JW881_06165 [Spirochaetales bacterium]|nr:hypothetical protein [Spirochaetales bacterium]
MPDLLLNPVIRILLIFVLPLFIIPLIMRFIVGRIVLFFVRRKFLPAYLKKLYRGWETSDDRSAIEAIQKLAFQRLRAHFIFKPLLVEDIKAILISIKNTYNPEADREKLTFSFSIVRLMECSLLAFSDLYREFGDAMWFKLIKNIRIIWFYRVWNLKKFYELVFSIPFIDRLRRTRVIGKLIRAALIPILGIPTLIWYVARSIVISVFFESFFRFFYALILMKAGYYAIYLYGKKNTHISKRIKSIPKKKLGELNSRIEEMIKPSLWREKSSRYPAASRLYRELLTEFGITRDASVEEIKENPFGTTKTILRRIASSFKKAYQKQNPFYRNRENDKLKLLRLYREIAGVYVPGTNEPFQYLRLEELIATGYMASVLILHKVLTTPGIRLLLDKISGDFAITLTSLVSHEAVKAGFKGAKDAYKYYRLYRLGSRAWRVVRGIVSPYTLIWTLGSPVLFQQLQDLLKEYAAHRIGRLMLYCWESHILKTKMTIIPILW